MLWYARASVGLAGFWGKILVASKKLRITKGILQSIQQKDKLYRQSLKNKDGESWMQYKSYRNKLTHVKERAKKLHFQNIIKKKVDTTLRYYGKK